MGWREKAGGGGGCKARPFSVKCGKFCLRAGKTNHMKVALVAQIVHRNAHVQHDKLKLSGTHTHIHTRREKYTLVPAAGRYFGEMPAPHTHSQLGEP